MNNFFYFSDVMKYLNDNIQAISEFPEDTQAQIKASGGKLGRADGTLWAINFVATKAGMFSELPGTIKVIDETFQAISNDFDKDYIQYTENGAVNREMIKVMAEKFTAELSMLEGLQNIKTVYHKRYDKVDNKKDALNNLDSSYETYEKIISTHAEKFQSIVDQYKKQREEEKMELSLPKSVTQPRPSGAPSTKKATEDVEAYLKKWSSGITLTQAKNLIEKGKQLYAGIVKGEITSPSDDEKGEASAVVHLSWFLMNLAIEKKQGHSQGAFTLEDENGALYNFLTQVKGCHDRESSHFVGRSKPSKSVTSYVFKSSIHKGIDETSGLLPADKRHLLFAQVDAPAGKGKLLFVKLEDFSPFVTTGYGKDMALHAVDLAVAQYNKKMNPGSDDLPEMAKERVPSKTLKEFYRIVNSLDEKTVNGAMEILKEKNMAGDPFKQAKTYGIAYMNAFITEVEKLDLAEGLQLFDSKAFKNSLPELDHMDKRTGKEVYLSAEEIRNHLA